MLTAASRLIREWFARFKPRTLRRLVPDTAIVRPCRTEDLEDRCLLSAGQLDVTFGDGGVTVTNVADSPVGWGVADTIVQPDGKILVVGTVASTTADSRFNLPSPYSDRENFDIFIARFLPDGGTETTSALDPSFGDDGILRLYVGPEYEAAGAIALLPDGKILIAGNAHGSRGTSQANYGIVIRLNSDGSRDVTFGDENGVAWFAGGPEWVTDMVVQSNGRIVVAGSDNSPHAGDDFELIAFTADGQPDLTFGTNGQVRTDVNNGTRNLPTRMQLLANDELLVSGTADWSSTGTAVVRYLSDGALDTSFATDGIKHFISDTMYDVVVMPDGRYLLGGGKNGASFLMMNSDGSVDLSFGNNGRIHHSLAPIGRQYSTVQKLHVLPDGRVQALLTTRDDYGDFYHAPSFAHYNPSTLRTAAQILPDGSLDPTFGVNGLRRINSGGTNAEFGFLHGAAWLPDGRILLPNDLWEYGGISRFTAAFDLDTTFDVDGDAQIRTRTVPSSDEAHGVSILPDGQILVTGRSRGVEPRFLYSGWLTGGGALIARYDASGHLDTSFDGWLKESFNGVGDGTVFPDLNSDSGRYEGGLIRDVVVRDDGTVFAPTLFDDRRLINGVSIDHHGHAYHDWTHYIYDNTSDGAEIGGVIPLTDGRIVLAARTNGEGVVVIVREAVPADDTNARYSEELRWSTGDFIPVAIRSNSDGDLLLTDGQRVVKYNLAGNVLADFESLLPDETFEIRDLAVQDNGKVVVAGKLFAGTTHHIFTARWKADGTIDSAYGDAGTVVSADPQSSEANAVVIQSNGRIVVFGNIGNSLAAVAYDGEGRADESFGHFGTTQIVATEDALAHVGTALAVQNDGAIVATGFITRDDGREDVVLLRLLGDTPVLTPTVTHVSPDSGRHDRDAVTNASQLTFHGTAQAGHLVTVTVNDTVAGTATAASDGTWSVDYSHVNLSEGIYGVAAVASEGEQSSHPSESLTVVIDQTAPEPSVPELRSDSHSPAGDNVIDVDAYVFGLRGFAELESSAFLYANGQPVKAFWTPGEHAWDIAASKRFGRKTVGEWTIHDHIDTVPFSYGKYSYATEVEDLAGNRSGRSDALNVWVVGSTGAPEVSVTGSGTWSEDAVPPLVLTVDPDFHGTPKLIWEGTATSGEDYLPSDLDFSQANINTIHHHQDDTLYEPDETITVGRRYGDIQFSEDILITIQENDAPTLQSIPDFVNVIGESIDPVFVTVGNFADGVDVPIDISVDNATLFPADSLVLSGAESFRLLTLTPAVGQSGSATITITAGHGNATIVESFVIDIQTPGGIHTIAPVADQVIEEDGASSAIPITLTGFDPDQVTVTARAQNTELVPAAGLQVTGAGANRSLTITPTPDAFGTTLVAVEAENASGDRFLRTFSLNVTPVNDAPELHVTTHSLAIEEDAMTELSTGGNPWIQVTDIDAGVVLVRVEASHGTLHSPINGASLGIAVSGYSKSTLTVNGPLAGVNTYLAALRYTPHSDYNGSDVITTSAIDAATFDVDYATTFISTSTTSHNGGSSITGPPNESDWYVYSNVTGLQTVTVGFDTPLFSNGANIVETWSGGFVRKVEAMDEAGNYTEVWSGADPLTEPGELNLSWPQTSFAVHGLRVTIDTDWPGFQGIDSIQLLGSHPLQPVSTSDPGIALTVTPVNDAPKLPYLHNVRITAGRTGTQTFNVTDAESPVADLQFEFTSANESLVPVSGISVDTSGTTPKLTFSGIADALGVSVVTVTATDPQELSSTIEFDVVVLPRSNYPALTSPDSVATDEDLPVSFTISVEDERATSEQLEVWAKRLSGPILSSIPVTGAGQTRTVTVTPQNSAYGTARIQIYVRNPLTDQTISGYVDINVSFVNDLPIIDTVDDRHAAIQSAVVLHQPPDLPLQIHEEEGSPLLVTMTADHGTLTAPSASHIAIIEGTGTGDTVMKVWGTEKSVNAFLDDLTFIPDDGFEGTAGIGIVAAERTVDDRIGQWADQVTGLTNPQAVVGAANRGYTNFAAQLAPVEITATFANFAFAEAISVFERIDAAWNAESPNDSKIRKVELQDTGGSWHTVWDGPTKYVGQDEFVEGFLSFPRTAYQVQAARVTFHDPEDSYNAQLDAIFLHSSLDIDVTTDASTSATIPIVVGNAPYDILLSTSTVSEAADNRTTSVEVGRLVAVDPDSVSHNFTLVSGSGDIDNAAFEIQGDRLLVKSGVVLDFETNPNFSVRIQADDGTLSYEKALAIAVADVAESVELSMIVPEVVEGGLAHLLTLTRNTSVSTTETMTLWTGHPASVQIPVSVTISAGQWTADVSITALDNFRTQGDFVATVAATRFGAPQAWLPVTIIDDDTTPVPVGNLSELDGTNGFRIDGIAAGDVAGSSIDTVGDLNGDGYDDVLVGAYRAMPNGSSSGQSYVVFGKADGFAPNVPLATLDGTNGFRIDGLNPGDFLGYSVSHAGDFNGDGVDDVMIGAFGVDSGVAGAGASYLIFGRTSGFGASLDLSTLDGGDGFRLDGSEDSDIAGLSVSSAGDVNSDGFSDLMIGAPRPTSISTTTGGPAAYVVFGSDQAFGPSINLATLNGSNGFVIEGIVPEDWAGVSVSEAGDVNGDGFGDIVLGDSHFNLVQPDPHAGRAYVIFGKQAGFSATINLSTLNGVNGFQVNGIRVGDKFGREVNSVGDINGDGLDDLIFGAALGEFGSTDSREGLSVVVFGQSTPFPAQLETSTLDGTNGFRIYGADPVDISGNSVSGAGDVNGDGFDDLIIGAFFAEHPSGPFTSGETYVIYGRAEDFPADVRLSELGSENGIPGFVLSGIDAGDQSGFAVSAAGDVNGDGFDDVAIGARLADGSPVASNEGEVYVVFGGNMTADPLTQAGNQFDNTIPAFGGGFADKLIGGPGDDVLISDGGADVLRGGEGNDVLAIPDVEFSSSRRLSGGTGVDTLRLDGHGLHLDLTSISDNRLVDIERIDITGNGANTLTLDVRDVLNASSHSNTLIVFRGIGDTVNIGMNWTSRPEVVIGSATFDVFAQGAAILKIQQLPPAPDLTATAFDAVSDHLILGKTNVTWTVANIGLADATAFETHIVWSANDILGDADDVVVADSGAAFAGITAGASESRTISLQLNRAALFAHAVASDPAGQGVGTVSTDSSRLFLVLDVNNDVAETTETNNSGQGHLVDNDDITYFPWDKNRNGIVEPLEALTSIRAIGSSDTASDFDGSGIVSPLEALSVIQRIGYVRVDVLAKTGKTFATKDFSSELIVPAASPASATVSDVTAETATGAAEAADLLSRTVLARGSRISAGEHHSSRPQPSVKRGDLIVNKVTMMAASVFAADAPDEDDLFPSLPNDGEQQFSQVMTDDEIDLLAGEFERTTDWLSAI